MSAIEDSVVELCRAARVAGRKLAIATTDAKDDALRRGAVLLRERSAEIEQANQRDLADGERAGLTAALLDRLTLDRERIEGVAEGLEQVAALDDPVGETIERRRRPNGLEISQVRIPIGVIGIIYESRPNVTADAAALCLKSGNAVVLKGGKEAIHTNSAIAKILNSAIVEAGLPAAAVQLIETTERAATRALLKQSDYVDVIIPRGGPSLIEAITNESSIPVIQHYAGICHVFVDAEADLEMARAIAVNSKVQRPGVCNAMETLLVHSAVADQFLPAAAAELEGKGVELRGCARTQALVPSAKTATEEDWRTEYLDLILSVRVVDGLQDAIDHIGRYGTGHSDAIVTDSYVERQSLHRRRRLVGRLRQRLDPLHRRVHVRIRRRGRYLHQPTARARPDGPAQPDHLQVRRSRQRADSRVSRIAPGRPEIDRRLGRSSRQRPGGGSAASVRVGIFGGTFDPIHLAHLRCVEEARESLALDRVLLIPAADPPHKRKQVITPAHHRLAMLRSAVRGHSTFRVSTIEIERDGPSFTIDTLRQLAATHPNWQLTLLMGIDAFAEIDTWKEYQALFEEVDIGVLSRPPHKLRNPRALTPIAVRDRFRYSPDRSFLINRNQNRVYFLSVSALEISATDIRDRVRRGRSIRFLVPLAVERYIERERLYRPGTATA